MKAKITSHEKRQRKEALAAQKKIDDVKRRIEEAAKLYAWDTSEGILGTVTMGEETVTVSRSSQFYVFRLTHRGDDPAKGQGERYCWGRAEKHGAKLQGERIIIGGLINISLPLVAKALVQNVIRLTEGEAKEAKERAERQKREHEELLRRLMPNLDECQRRFIDYVRAIENSEYEFEQMMSGENNDGASPPSTPMPEETVLAELRLNHPLEMAYVEAQYAIKRRSWQSGRDENDALVEAIERGESLEEARQIAERVRKEEMQRIYENGN